LNPYVRGKYLELWRASEGTPKRYVQIWSNPQISAWARTLEEMITAMPEDAVKLKEMQEDGITLDSEQSRNDGYYILMTTDSAVAQKHGLHEDSELWHENGP